MSLSRVGRAIEASGFGNGRGHISFNKCVTFTMLWAWTLFLAATVYLSWLDKPMPSVPLIATVAGMCSVVIGAGFGLKGFLGARKSSGGDTHG